MIRAGWRMVCGQAIVMLMAILLSRATSAAALTREENLGKGLEDSVGAVWGLVEGGVEPALERDAMEQAAGMGELPAGSLLDDEARGFEESFLSLMVKLGLGLGLVVLLAWGTVYLLRKSGIGLQGGGDDGAICIIERAYLGPKKDLFLVEVGELTLVLGVTAERITRLAQWRTGKVELRRGRREPVSPFTACLNKLRGQGEGTPFNEEHGQG